MKQPDIRYQGRQDITQYPVFQRSRISDSTGTSLVVPYRYCFLPCIR